jgi:hypothetical protein
MGFFQLIPSEFSALLIAIFHETGNHRNHFMPTKSPGNPEMFAETPVFHDENPAFFNQGAHAPTPRAGPFGPFSGGAIAGPSFASIKSAWGMR